MKLSINWTRFLLLWPLLIAVQTSLILIFWNYLVRAGLGSNQLTSASPSLGQLECLLGISALFSGSFLLVYAQGVSGFPKLKGGLVYGLLVGLILAVPFSLLSESLFADPLVQHWGRHLVFVCLLIGLVSGGICGSLYVPPKQAIME